MNRLRRAAAVALILAALLPGRAVADPPAGTPMPQAVAEAIVLAFPFEEWNNAAYVARCESRYEWWHRIVDLNGEISAGLWQVQPVSWGPVPHDPMGQALQVARIISTTLPDGSRVGWSPWWWCNPAWR